MLTKSILTSASQKITKKLEDKSNSEILLILKEIPKETIPKDILTMFVETISQILKKRTDNEINVSLK